MKSNPFQPTPHFTVAASLGLCVLMGCACGEPTHMLCGGAHLRNPLLAGRCCTADYYPPCFGYTSTCWHPWPGDCPTCPPFTLTPELQEPIPAPARPATTNPVEDSTPPKPEPGPSLIPTPPTPPPPAPNEKSQGRSVAPPLKQASAPQLKQAARSLASYLRREAPKEDRATTARETKAIEATAIEPSPQGTLPELAANEPEPQRELLRLPVKPTESHFMSHDVQSETKSVNRSSVEATVTRPSPRPSASATIRVVESKSLGATPSKVIEFGRHESSAPDQPSPAARPKAIASYSVSDQSRSAEPSPREPTANATTSATNLPATSQIAATDGPDRGHSIPSPAAAADPQRTNSETTIGLEPAKSTPVPLASAELRPLPRRPVQSLSP